MLFSGIWPSEVKGQGQLYAIQWYLTSWWVRWSLNSPTTSTDLLRGKTDEGHHMCQMFFFFIHVQFFNQAIFERSMTKVFYTNLYKFKQHFSYWSKYVHKSRAWTIVFRAETIIYLWFLLGLRKAIAHNLDRPLPNNGPLLPRDVPLPHPGPLLPPQPPLPPGRGWPPS